MRSHKTPKVKPKWIKTGEGKAPIGKGTNQPMKFRTGRKWRPKHGSP